MNNNQHLLNNRAYCMFYRGDDIFDALPGIYVFTVYGQHFYRYCFFFTICRRNNYCLFFAIAVKVVLNTTLPLTTRIRHRQHVFYRLPFENYCIIALPSRFVTALRIVTAMYLEFLNNC